MREMAMNTAAANDLVRISPNGTKVRTIPATVQRFVPAMPLRARLRVAAYARVSTDEEEQLSSYEAQVDYYTRYIQSNPEWTFVEVYADEGLARAPFGCAVSIHHRLASRDQLQLSDLYGENLMLMHRGWSHYVDQLRDDLWQHHPQIHIVDFDFYSMDVFNRCESTNDVLLAISGWASVHPLLKVLPVEWDYSIPYGILHSPEPSPIVQRFLDVAKVVGKELYG